MTVHRRPANQARAALLDAAVIAATIDAALGALEVGLGGFPTSTPGAGPSSPQTDAGEPDVVPELAGDECGHQPAETSTPVEISAAQFDKARADQAVLLKSLDTASRQLARAAGVCHRWAFAGVDATTVTARLVSIDQDIWCQHCSTFGRHEPRKDGYLKCDWCQTFTERYKRPPPKEIWDARDARGGRLDLTTISRILAQLRAERKAAEALRKANQRALAKAAKTEEAGHAQ